MNKENTQRLCMKRVFIFSPLKRKKCKKSLYFKRSRNIFLHIFKKNIEKESKNLANFLIDIINMITTSNSFKINKFKFLKQNIIDSPFIDNKSKNQLINMFSNTQRQYSSLRHFVHIYKFKTASFYENEDDLCSTSLKSFPEIQKIAILHENKKYIFRLTDLANCWKSSLTHQEDLFPSPIQLKNPYTNITFKQNDLYNIYFRLEFSQLNTNFLIREYFKLGFDNKKFYIKFSIILKDVAIKNYIFHADQKELIDDLKDMCLRYFPKYEGEQNLLDIKKSYEQSIIKKMRNYLQLYYIIEYSRNITIIKKCRKLLEKELEIFFNMNRSLFKDFFDENKRPLRIIETKEMKEFLKDFSYV